MTSPAPRLLVVTETGSDDLSGQLATLEWQIERATPYEALRNRLLSGDARLILVDTRGDAAAVGHVHDIGQIAEAHGGALIAITDDALNAANLFAAGATHVVGPGSGPDGVAFALMGAAELVRRLDRVPATIPAPIKRRDSLYWREEEGMVQLSPALATRLALAETPQPPARVLRRLPRALRRGLLLALRREQASDAPEGFVQDIIIDTPEDGRVLIHLAPEGKALVGEVTLESASSAVPAHNLDYLTGLTNRAEAIAWLGQAVAGGEPPLCLLLGISQFDSINAAYGRAAGDALLARVAARVARCTRELAGPDALVARVAGTEFLVGLPGGSKPPAQLVDAALFLAQQLVATVARPFTAGDHLIQMTARCGIAEGLVQDDAARLLRRVTAALADARKANGRDICLRTSDRRGRRIDHDRLDADLRLALGRGEIAVLFQPQYRTADDKMVGVEALARWNHPRLGQLGAAALFGAAERSDTLLPLSRHIQSETLRLAGQWPASLDHLRLSINVTATDLAQTDFLSHFLDMVERSGFPASRVTVEITETELIENIAAASTLIAELRQAGLRVAIDDFGTGYSSLAYLKALELDYLKIDSGLTQDIAGAPRDRIIVRGIIAMAKSLSMTVIAEGVEHDRQLTLLAQEGCDLYQGFLRSAALANPQLVALVEQDTESR